MMHMRTTLNIDDALLAEARKMTGIEEKTALVHEGLKSLIEREAARYLASMGGSMRGFQAGRRRRSEPTEGRGGRKKAG